MIAIALLCSGDAMADNEDVIDQASCSPRNFSKIIFSSSFTFNAAFITHRPPSSQTRVQDQLQHTSSKLLEIVLVDGVYVQVLVGFGSGKSFSKLHYSKLAHWQDEWIVCRLTHEATLSPSDNRIQTLYDIGAIEYPLLSNAQVFCKSILFHWSIYVCVRTIVGERQDTIGT
jgi:hypothetical protein